MVKSTIYKGIEFVRLSAMPKSEQDLFQKTFNPNLYIKILIGEEVVHDCVQYKDYASWFATMFPKTRLAESVTHEELLHESALVD
jgi:hypothetical protein